MTIAFSDLAMKPATFEWWKESNSQEGLESPLDKSVQTLELPGAKWRAAVEMPPMFEPKAGAFEAFWNSLRGRAGRFLLYNYQRPLPNGTIGAAGALVNGNQAVSASLLLKGVAVGKTLLAGDYIGFNSELRQVIATATANGSGLMTVSLDCPFRNPVTDGMAVVTDRPAAIFMLPNDDSPHSLKDSDKKYGFRFECLEVW
jgi:hypothetical protein